eukprot:gene9517-1724_t
MNLILGSSSKWRRETIEQWYPNKKIMMISPNIDEKAIRHENPNEMVQLIAQGKANEIINNRLEKDHPESILITCDQIVLFKDKVREKPEDIEEAKNFLRSYEFGPAVCVNGIVVTNTKTKKTVCGYNRASIHFKKIPEDVIDKLIKEGDAMNCSGGFASEEENMQPFIEKIEGTRDEILGMPKDLIFSLIQKICE